jgi:DNA-binding response OmpR family regulator
VLFDVIMPGVDGAEVLSWIKKESELRHVPVIMISGLDDDERTAKCNVQGAEDYLAKPVKLVLLDALVGPCLRRRQGEKHRLEQYFSRELAGELAFCHEDILQARYASVTILFCDDRRCSFISERIGARTTIEWIASTMVELSRIVFRE